MRRRPLYLVPGTIIVACALAYALLPKPEPSYGGVKLSEWVAMYGGYGPYHYTNSVLEKAAAQQAIGHIGTNAVPYLVDWLNYTFPDRKGRFYNFADSQMKRLHLKWSFIKQRNDRLFNALAAFKALQPQADGACAELVRICMEGKGSKPYRCVNALTAFEDKGVPALLTLLTNGHLIARRLAATNLGILGTNALPAVPALRQVLDHPDFALRDNARIALIQIERSTKEKQE